MNVKYDLKGLSRNIVYLKPVDVADLPDEVQAQVEDGLETLFAVHNGEGHQVALVADREIAAHLAYEHDMRIVTLH